MAALEIGEKRPCLIVIAGARLGEIFPVEGELLIGRTPDATICIPDDEGVSRQHARVVTQDGVASIVDLGSANGIYVDDKRVTKSTLRDGAKIRVGQSTVLKHVLYDGIEEKAQRQLLMAALRDPGTMAFNRRYFFERLKQELRFASRHKQALALFLYQLENYTAFRSELGAGSDVELKRLVQATIKTLRTEDVVARLESDTFALLVRNLPRQHVESFGERVRQEMEAFAFSGSTPRLQCAVGAALFLGGQPDESENAFVARAETALAQTRGG